VPGTLKGKFTVDENGKQVYFSQGNLQYNAYQDKWRFAKNQWDFVGDNVKGTVTEGGVKSSNSKISSNYDGWIDLFGWGTGKNPTQTSTNTSDYHEFFEWGDKPIVNGGNTAELWRTLKSGEWAWLFRGRANAEDLFGLGNINGINGVFLLPDNWTKPEGVNFTPSTKCEDATLGKLELQGETYPYFFNEKAESFQHNPYTEEQWAKMEAAGAVFIPIAGVRNGEAVNNVNINGFYWAATPYEAGQAFDVYIYPAVLGPEGIGQRHLGLSVRLVRNVE
jgi:hypothetical protein